MYKRLIFLSIIGILVSMAGAAEYRSGESITIQEEDSLFSDLFVGSRYVNIRGVVAGDIFVGCEQATVEGRVLDDVIAGCRNLQISGDVDDMVIGFAETIVIDGEVGGDVIGFGKILRITQRAKIKGNVYVGAGELLLEGGSIGGFIKGGAGKVHLNGTVKGKVELEAGDIYFGPDYLAKGGTKLTLHKDLSEYELENVPDDLEVEVKSHSRFFQEAFFYWYLLSLLIVGILIIALFKNFSRDYISFAGNQIGKNFGFGFLGLVATPIVIVILAVLILTIPVSLILLSLFIILNYLSMAFSALFVGNYVISSFKKEKEQNNMFLSVLLGVILVTFVTEIPFIGWLFNLIIISFGMGSLGSYIWSLKQKPKLEKDSISK